MKALGLSTLKQVQLVLGTHEEADCTITMESSDFIDLYNGDAQGAMLFMGGQLQIEGNMGLALQLGEIMG